MECFYQVTTGVLSILVTVLIGWQIYSVFYIEKKLNKKINANIEVARKQLEKIIDKKIIVANEVNHCRTSVSLANMHVNLTLVYQQVKLFKSAASSVVQSLHYSEQTEGFYDVLPVIKSTVIGYIEIIKKDISKEDRALFTALIYRHQGKNSDIDDIIQAYEQC